MESSLPVLSLIGELPTR